MIFKSNELNKGNFKSFTLVPSTYECSLNKLPIENLKKNSHSESNFDKLESDLAFFNEYSKGKTSNEIIENKVNDDEKNKYPIKNEMKITSSKYMPINIKHVPKMNSIALKRFIEEEEKIAKELSIKSYKNEMLKV